MYSINLLKVFSTNYIFYSFKFQHHLLLFIWYFIHWFIFHLWIQIHIEFCYLFSILQFIIIDIFSFYLLIRLLVIPKVRSLAISRMINGVSWCFSLLHISSNCHFLRLFFKSSIRTLTVIILRVWYSTIFTLVSWVFSVKEISKS